MNYLLLITIISAICSILSFLTSKVFKSRVWLWSVVVFILTFASGYAIYSNSELEKTKNIHRQAQAINDHYVPFGDYREFIQESLTFLEENRDRYPESYERAKEIYAETRKPQFVYYSDAASEMRGIIKSIAELNK